MAEIVDEREAGRKDEASTELKADVQAKVKAEQSPVARPRPRQSAQSSRAGGRDTRVRRGRYRRRPKVCYFCANKVVYIDHKEVDTLRRSLTNRAKIRPRRQTGTCAKHQRRLATAVKRARHLALLPFTADLSQDR